MTDFFNALTPRQFPHHPGPHLWLAARTRRPRRHISLWGTSLFEFRPRRNHGVWRNGDDFSHVGTSVRWTLIQPLPTALLAIPVGILATIVLTLLIDRFVYRYHRERRPIQ